MRCAIPPIVCLLVLLAPAVLEAQGTGPNVPITAPLEQQFAGDLTALHDKIVALAEAIPPESYSWRPAPEVRTVAQVLMHMAGEWLFLCPRAIAADPPADLGSPSEAMRALELIEQKNEVLGQLRKSWTYCRAALDRIDPAKLVPDSLPGKMGFPRVALLVSGDQHEHLGQLIAYARSLGVTPPWSR
jgi:uncharacterized damage-inducible protein DinB